MRRMMREKDFENFCCVSASINIWDVLDGEEKSYVGFLCVTDDKQKAIYFSGNDRDTENICMFRSKEDAIMWMTEKVINTSTLYTVNSYQIIPYGLIKMGINITDVSVGEIDLRR